jgi:hypothetical protein
MVAAFVLVLGREKVVFASRQAMVVFFVFAVDLTYCRLSLGIGAVIILMRDGSSRWSWWFVRGAVSVDEDVAQAERAIDASSLKSRTAIENTAK